MIKSDDKILLFCYLTKLQLELGWYVVLWWGYVTSTAIAIWRHCFHFIWDYHLLRWRWEVSFNIFVVDLEMLIGWLLFA